MTVIPPVSFLLVCGSCQTLIVTVPCEELYNAAILGVTTHFGRILRNATLFLLNTSSVILLPNCQFQSNHKYIYIYIMQNYIAQSNNVKIANMLSHLIEVSQYAEINVFKELKYLSST